MALRNTPAQAAAKKITAQLVLRLYKLNSFPLLERVLQRTESNFMILNCHFLFQLGHSWLLCLLGAGRCLYMGKISLRSTKQLPWIFTMSAQEFFMLILKGRQRYLERFGERSTELYPLSEEEKGNRDTVAARVCEAQMNLESDKERLYSQTLASCGSLIYTHFILIHPLSTANYLLLTWISKSTCEYSLCKLSRLQFVLSCDYKDHAVLALHWHVITMDSMTTVLGFLELLGTWPFSLAVSHLKQIRHSVCFVIESNKQDKLASKQWRRAGRCRRSQAAQVLLHNPQSRQKVCVGRPTCCHWPCAHVL